MSLKSIGNLNNLGKKFDSYSKDSSQYKSARDNIIGTIGSIIKGKEYPDAVATMKQAGLSEELQKAALGFAEIKAPAEDAAEAVRDAGTSFAIFKNIKDVFSGLKQSAVNAFTSIIGVLQKLKDAWAVSKLFTTAMIAIPTAIVAVTGAFIYFATSASRAQKAMQSSAEEFEDSKSAVESVNKELENTQSQMDELLAKKGLTFVEEDELERLKQDTKELELQKNLREEEEKTSAKKLASKTEKAFNKNYGNYSLTPESIDSYVENHTAIDDKNATELLGIIQFAQQKMEEAQNAGDLEEADRFSQLIDGAKGKISDIVDRYSEYKENLEEASTVGVLTDSQRELYNQISDDLNFIYKTLYPEEYKQSQLDDVLNTTKFADAKKSLTDLAKQTSETGITVDQVKEKFPELADAVEEAGFTIDDLVNKINSDAGALNLDEVSKQVKEMFQETEQDRNKTKYPDFVGPIKSEVEDFNKWIDSLDSKDLALVYQIKLDTGSDELSLEDWQKELQTRKDKDKISFTPTTIEKMLKDSSKTSPTTVTGYIDEFQSDMDALASAMNQLKTGDFKESDITDLIQQFPELASKTDDLSNAISKLSLKKMQSVFKKINNQMKNMVNSDDYDAANLLKLNMAKLADTSNISNTTKEKAIRDAAWSNITGQESVEKAQKFLSQFSKEMGTDKGLDILYRLIADPTELEKTLSEIQSDYKNLEIDYDIKISEDSISKLENQLTDLKNASNIREAQNNLKVANGGVLTESDYQYYIDNAMEQYSKQKSQEGEYRTLRDKYEVGSDKYNEYQQQIDALEASSTNILTNIAGWKKNIKELPVTKLQNQLTGLQNKSTKYQDDMNTKQAKGIDLKYDDYQALIQNSKEQQSNLEQQNVLLQSQLAGLDRQSQSYQDISSQIISNNTAIETAKQNQIEWNETAKALPSVFLETLDSINSIVNAQSSGASIDPSTFNSEDLKDYQSALEWVNGSLQLNKEKVDEITKARSEEKISIYEENSAMAKLQYRENSEEIANLKDNYDNLTDAQKDQLNTLLSQQTELVNQASYWDLQAQSIREATGAYQEWLDAQNAPESGDMFDETQKAWQLIRDTADSSSENYNRTGRKDYQAAVKFLIPDNIDQEDEVAVQKYLDSIAKYFYYDQKSGEMNGLNIDQFLDDAIAKGLMNQDDNGVITIAAEKTAQDFANAFNFTPEMMQSMFGELQEYYPEIDWSHFESTDDALYQATLTIDELQDKIDYLSTHPTEIKVDENGISDLDKLNAQLEKAKKLQAELSTQKVGESSDAYQNYIEAQKELSQLEYGQTFGNNIDQSQLDEARRKVEKLKEDLEAMSMPTTLEINVQINNLENEKQKLSSALTSAENSGAPDNITGPLKHDISSLETQIENFKELKIYVDKKELETAQQKVDNLENTKISDKEFSVNVVGDAETTLKNIQSYLNDIRDKDVHINVIKTESSGNSSKEGTGSASGNAHVSGSFKMQHAYGHALANGVWGAEEGGKALVGELGTEVIVDPHTGRWHTVGDNGAEFVDVPKGAIVFNHLQSKALLENGHISSRGKALASGNAYADYVSASFKRKNTRTDSQVTWANSPSNSSDSTSSTTANTKATNANTKATKSNTSAKEKSTQVFDWVSRRLTVLSDAVQRTADTITDYVSSAFKAKQLKKEVKQIDAQINGNKKGAAAYLAKAEEVAKAYKYTDDNGNEQTVSVSDEYKRKVRNGEWSIEDMDTSTKEGKALAEAIQSYQEYYEKFEDCNDAIQGLYNTQLDLYKDLCNIPLDDAAKKVEKFTNAITNLSAAADIAGSGTSSIAAYKRVLKQRKQAYQNEATKSLKPAQDLLKSYGKVILTGLTSKNVKINSKTKDSIAETVQQGKSLSTSQVKALKKAGLGNAATNYTKRLNWNNKLQTTVTSGTKNSFTKAEQMVLGYDSKKTASYHLQNAMVNEEVAQKRNIMNTDYAAMKKAKSTMDSDKKAYSKAKDSASKKATSILGNKKFKLTASQKKALKAGELVDTSVITDPTLLSQINAYNSNVTSRKKAYSKYKISREAYNTAQQTSQESTTAYVQSKAEAPITKLENTQNWYDAKVSTLETTKSKVEAENSLKQSQGYDLSNEDYLKQINANKQIEYQKKAERDVLQKQLDSSTLDKNSEEYQKWADQITQLDTEIMQLSETNHGLYDDMRNNGYKVFERMYDASEKLRKSYSAIKDLINDDMTFDDDGKFTNAGLVSLDQTMKTYQSNQQDLDTALKQRQSYIDRFNTVNEDGTKKYPEYSQQEFDNDMQNVTTTIQESIAATNASRQEAINMIAAQAKAELDALNKVIDARKEALQKKEEYYEYDKKIKSQTNDLKSLDQQIQALEGVQTEEGRAQKARLEAQRKESQESLDDTVIQHQYEMQVEGLSDLSNQLQENYETYVKELNRNFDTANKQLDAVNRYLDANQGIIQKAANEIIKGVTGKDIDFSNLSYKSNVWYSEPSKKARGDRRVNSDQIAITQEKGEEMIMYKGGLITPLHAGDTVFNHTLTERLYDMAQNYPNLMSVPSVTRSLEANNIAPVISCPITINGNANEQDIINAVNKMMPQINKSVTTAIRSDLRKAH